MCVCVCVCVCVLWTRTILAGMTPVRCIYSSDSREEEQKNKCKDVEMRQQEHSHVTQSCIPVAHTVEQLQ